MAETSSETVFSPPLVRPSLAPRHWGGWLAVALLWVLGRLPRWLGRALVAPLGPLLRLGLASRRRIAERNLAVCLPELSDAERERILRDSFASLARMLVETAWCWAGDAQDLQSIADIDGLEHIEDAISRGQGILVVTAHMTCLEMGARILGERWSGRGLYRPLNNPVVEWYQNRGRSRYASGMISKRDMRGAIRFLRAGGFLWYAPDQDFGARNSVFAPFFGIETATLLATQRLPGMTGCLVVTMFPRYVPETKRYRVSVSAPLEKFPSDDPVADLARLNTELEAQVRAAPEQYWWIHRRFKTRPEGEPDFYGRDARRA